MIQEKSTSLLLRKACLITFVLFFDTAATIYLTFQKPVMELSCQNYEELLKAFTKLYDLLQISRGSSE